LNITGIGKCSYDRSAAAAASFAFADGAKQRAVPDGTPGPSARIASKHRSISMMRSGRSATPCYTREVGRMAAGAPQQTLHLVRPVLSFDLDQRLQFAPDDETAAEDLRWLRVRPRRS
jgi:hypothetical protein